MPTRLPPRGSLLRRHAPSAETMRNLASTFAEFGLALVFVAAVVVLIAALNVAGNVALPALPPPPFLPHLSP